jgi:Zn-dependent protease
MHHIYDIVIYAIPLIFAITMHESAHGWMARRYGDMTASMLGRVTLNPIPHIDLVGTIIVPGVLLLGSALTGFGGVLLGWAKPVPVNTRNLTPFRQGMFMVALAGPASNLLQAFVWLLLLKIFLWTGFLTQSLLDLTIAGVLVNFYLMAFNLLPLPPLDGGRIVTMLLPYEAAVKFAEIERYGMVILVVLIISGFLTYFMHPFVWTARRLLTWALL